MFFGYTSKLQIKDILLSFKFELFAIKHFKLTIENKAKLMRIYLISFMKDA